MSRRLILPAFAPALGLFSLLACGGSYQSAATPTPARPVNQASNILTGTCKEYDVRAGTMDVISGVSFALRETTFRIHDNTEITIRDRRADLTDMRAGMVVRVEYRVTPQGNLADRIDVVMDATGMR